MTTDATPTHTEETCPRCLTGRLRRWEELDDAGREVVRRLPESADRAPGEREARHRWCARCWHEEADERPRAV